MAMTLSRHLAAHIADSTTPHIERPQGWLNLSSNEMGHNVCVDLADVFFRRLQPQCVRSYPAHDSVRRIAAEWLEMAPEQILFTAGSDDAVRMIVGALTATRGHLILQSPNYDSYEVYARQFRCRTTEVPIAPRQAPRAFCGDLKRLLPNCAPSVVVITNPNGFSGAVYGGDELRSIAETCQASEHMLVIDEAYSVYAPVDHRSLVATHDNVLLIRSFSKSFGMAGLRLGLVAGSAAVIEYLARWQPENPVSSVATQFFVHCLEHLEIIEAAHRELMSYRDEVTDTLPRRMPGWEGIPTATNFVLLEAPSIEDAARLTHHLAARCIRIRHLMNVAGFERLVRMTVWQRHMMTAAIDAIDAFACMAGEC